MRITMTATDRIPADQAASLKLFSRREQNTINNRTTGATTHESNAMVTATARESYNDKIFHGCTITSSDTNTRVSGRLDIIDNSIDGDSDVPINDKFKP